MTRWSIIILILAILVAAYAVYDTQHPRQTPLPQNTPQIIPGVSSVEYRDGEFGFSIFYPETANPSVTNYDGYLPRTQTPAASFVLPANMSLGTNLSEAGVYIGATSSPAIVATCASSSPELNETAQGTTTISGTNFSVFTSSDAGAGNFYETKTLRTVHGDLCFEIVELLHSTNIGNYDPGTVLVFDKTAFQGYLDAMVKTFTFTDR